MPQSPGTKDQAGKQWMPSSGGQMKESNRQIERIKKQSEVHHSYSGVVRITENVLME
jgi:hypothetical protein